MLKRLRSLRTYYTSKSNADYSLLPTSTPSSPSDRPSTSISQITRVTLGQRTIILIVLASVYLSLMRFWYLGAGGSGTEVSDEVRYPLLWDMVERGEGQGGRWYIPTTWLEACEDSDCLPPSISRTPRTALEAANLLLFLSQSQDRYIQNTTIPLILHQTWKDLKPSKWSKAMKTCVDLWLQMCSHPESIPFPSPSSSSPSSSSSSSLSSSPTPSSSFSPPPSSFPEHILSLLPSSSEVPDFATPNVSSNEQMGYVLWDDAGVEEFIRSYESDHLQAYEALPAPVEKADMFRIAVLRWFGGVYADTDTLPLRHPSTWILASDLTPWTDPLTSTSYKPSPSSPSPPPKIPSTAPSSYHFTPPPTTSRPISAIVGLEADTPPHTDTNIRLGYTYHVQLQNWALALAPHHPISLTFLDNLLSDVRDVLSDSDTDSGGKVQSEVDPILLTGPAAITEAVMENVRVRWDALSGLEDGGRSKGVGDVLVLPMTGFSPGRGSYHNMGSKPITHPDARLYHTAQGSWKYPDLRVTAGKLCKTILGSGCPWDYGAFSSHTPKVNLEEEDEW